MSLAHSLHQIFWNPPNYLKHIAHLSNKYLLEVIRKFFGRKEPLQLIVNLARVKYMDSSGLGELISCYTALRRVNGHVKLLHLNSRLRHLLAITNLDTVFETFDSEPAAVSSFAPRTERIEDVAH